MRSSLQSVTHFLNDFCVVTSGYVCIVPCIQARLLLSTQFTTEAKARRLALIGVLPSFAGEDHDLSYDLSL
jgi:hypothetical protein